jgi:hypothetical protein
MKDSDGEEGGEGEKDGNDVDSDSLDDMYTVKGNQIDCVDAGEDGDVGENGDVGEDADASEDEDAGAGEGGNGRKAINGGENGYGDDDEELGGSDNEGRNGEGSRSVKQAGTKRKAIQDHEPATATTGRVKRVKKDGSGGDQEAIKLAKKAQPKRKYSKK